MSIFTSHLLPNKCPCVRRFLARGWNLQVRSCHTKIVTKLSKKELSLYDINRINPDAEMNRNAEGARPFWRVVCSIAEQPSLFVRVPS